MSAKVAFIEDRIRKDGSVVARLVARDTVDFDRLLIYMQNGTGLAQTDMKAVFEHFMNALLFFLPGGGKVQTPLGTFSMSLGKRSPTVDRSALSERTVNPEMITVRLRPSRALVDGVKHAAAIEVVDTPAIQCPAIVQVANLERADTFNAGSEGQILEIKGSRLSFSKEDVETGVFLIDAERGTETRVALYSRIGSARLGFKIPPVPRGSYTLRVRTRPSGRGLRTGEYAVPIEVG